MQGMKDDEEYITYREELAKISAEERNNIIEWWSSRKDGKAPAGTQLELKF